MRARRGLTLALASGRARGRPGTGDRRTRTGDAPGRFPRRSRRVPARLSADAHSHPGAATAMTELPARARPHPARAGAGRPDRRGRAVRARRHSGAFGVRAHRPGGRAAARAREPDPRRVRDVGRQRRPEHAGPLRRRRLLPPPPDHRAQAGRAAQNRRPLRPQSRHGRVRAAVAGRRSRDRARLRHDNLLLALHLHGVLAHRRAESRRGIRLDGSACRWHAAGRCAGIRGECRGQAVACGREPRSRAGGVRRPGEVSARRFFEERARFEHVAGDAADGNPSRQLLRAIAQSALDASALVQEACATDADRLRPGAARSAQDRGADRGGSGAPVPRRFATTRSTPMSIRTTCISACSPTPPMRSPRSWLMWRGSGAPTT